MTAERQEQIDNLERQLEELQGKKRPCRYQDKRAFEKKIRDLQAQIKKLNKPLKSIKQVHKIPFRLDDWNKRVIIWINETKLMNEKYQYIVDMIGGRRYLDIYIQWFKNKEKTAEQLTSLHIKDIKVVINNYISNQIKNSI